VLTTGRLEAAKDLRFKTIREDTTLTIARAKLNYGYKYLKDYRVNLRTIWLTH
jgi:hypothetical protein